MNTRLFTVLILLLFMVSGAQAAEPWTEKLQQSLPLLGHRNWVVVVDSGYWNADAEKRLCEAMKAAE